MKIATVQNYIKRANFTFTKFAFSIIGIDCRGNNCVELVVILIGAAHHGNEPAHLVTLRYIDRKTIYIYYMLIK